MRSETGAIAWARDQGIMRIRQSAGGHRSGSTSGSRGAQISCALLASDAAVFTVDQLASEGRRSRPWSSGRQSTEKLRERFAASVIASVIAAELASSGSERLKAAANRSRAEVLLLEGVGEL